MSEQELEFPARPRHPNALAATRAGLFMGWTALKMTAKHPTHIIAAIETKNNEQIIDKSFVEFATHVLEHQLGTPPYELYLADSIEEVRQKYDIPSQIPVRELSEHIQ